MKKMTKKEFASYPQYIIQIDWMTSYRVEKGLPSLSHMTINANDSFEAIKEAEELINDMDIDSIYMVTMFSKTEQVINDGYQNQVVYKTTICTRNIYQYGEIEQNHAWHIHDNAHHEAKPYNIGIYRDNNDYRANYGIA